MKLKSLILNGQRLEIAEVEIEFIPGIPQIHFLGLPDRLIKESFYRIKSALKNSGYKFPLTSQMIVNIKPNHLRKSSRGVELAVALGILLKTEQISNDLIDRNWILYGELGLEGSVYEPSDLTEALMHFRNETFLTGPISTQAAIHTQMNSVFRFEKLQNIRIERPEHLSEQKSFDRPSKGLEQKYSKAEAEFLFLTASLGQHVLLAGASGAGKSTLAKALTSFLPEPTEAENIFYQNNWRPVINPHQSITPAAFLGGGTNIYQGEIERVQGGLLVMDEFLEFDNEILESLRGPMTGETLRLSRGAFTRQIEAQFQVIATTNLCRCGQWTPLMTNINCRFSRSRCTKYLERLSGPILDRFSILFFVAKTNQRSVTGHEILNRIQVIQKFSKNILFADTNPLIAKLYDSCSTRRRNYLDAVAKIYAVERSLKASTKTAGAQALRDGFPIELTFQDYEKAEIWALKPFEQLEKGMS